MTADRLRTLLAVLAMSAGEPVSVARLAAATWDDDLPADARRSVQTLLFLTWTMNGHGQVGSSFGGRALLITFVAGDGLRPFAGSPPPEAAAGLAGHHLDRCEKG